MPNVINKTQDREVDVKAYLEEKRGFVNAYLKSHFKSPFLPSPLYESITYSLFAGGKRIRPILAFASYEACGGNACEMLPQAAALELIHTYSLIHDDLPAMDNDDLRRGKPTNHKMFGEAAAILAGDGLLTLAFDLMSDTELAAVADAENRMRLINIVARAAGPMGMVGGQALDIASEGNKITFDLLKDIHGRKTGALITASVQAGALLGNASKAEFAALTTYGERIGLAFQIVDDLLNVTGSAEELGKAVGTDAALQKATYPAFFGVEETRNRARKAVDEAIAALADFDSSADPLRELARYIYQRTN